MSQRWSLKPTLDLLVCMLLFACVSLAHRPITFGIFIVYVIPCFLVLARAMVLVNRNRVNAFSISMDKKALIIRHGIRNRQENHLPYSAIQGIGLERDVRDRVLKLSSLSIKIRARGLTEEAKESLRNGKLTRLRGDCLVLGGLELPDALRLKQILQEKCGPLGLSRLRK